MAFLFVSKAERILLAALSVPFKLANVYLPFLASSYVQPSASAKYFLIFWHTPHFLFFNRIFPLLDISWIFRFFASALVACPLDIAWNLSVCIRKVIHRRAWQVYYRTLLMRVWDKIFLPWLFFSQSFVVFYALATIIPIINK